MNEPIEQQVQAHAVVSLGAQICNAKVAVCEQCGTEFAYERENRARFCGSRCRVAWHRKMARPVDPTKERCTLAMLAAFNRAEKLDYLKRKRSGIGMQFDGRTSGKPRAVGLNRPAGYADTKRMEAQ